MDRSPAVKRKTCLTYKTEEKTVVRGYDLGELAEKGYTYADCLFILFQGRIPTANEAKMLNYETAEFLEHSMSPSAASAIAVMSGRPMLPAAIAAGIMTFGGAHGPGAAHTYMLNHYLNRAKNEGKTLKEMAKILVDEHLEFGYPIMGVHQPQHYKGDPRALPTRRKAAELGTAGIHQEFQGEILDYLNSLRAKEGKEPLHLNMIGAGNSALLDLGFSGLAAWVIGVCVRGWSCGAHAVETLKRKRAWAASRKEKRVQMLDLSMIEYIGPEDRVVPDYKDREEHAKKELEKGDWEEWNL